MQITDIVAEQARTGARILDLTPPEAEICQQAWLSRATLTEEPASLTVVLQTLPGANLDAGSGTVVHVLFFERVEAFVEDGLLDAASQGGWELLSTHATPHKTYRFAAVLHVAESREHLRALNEYRHGKLVLRVREEQIERLQERLTRADARAKRHEQDAENAREQIDELRTRLAEMASALEQAKQRDDQGARHAEAARAELEPLRARLREVAPALEQARETAGRLRARMLALEPELAETRQRLARARGSFSFRVGRATKLALRQAGPRGS
jgi:hypothetical protein